MWIVYKGKSNVKEKIQKQSKEKEVIRTNKVRGPVVRAPLYLASVRPPARRFFRFGKCQIDARSGLKRAGVKKMKHIRLGSKQACLRRRDLDEQV